jgi:hypothetical protein
MALGLPHLLAVGAACIAACSAIVGIGDLPGRPSDGGDDDAVAVGEDAARTDQGAPRDDATAHDSSADDASSACARCVSIPAGWTGPVALLTSNAVGSFPSCQPPYDRSAYTGYGALAVPSPQCACTCGSPTGGNCAAALNLYESSDCSGTPCFTNPAAPVGGACTGLNDCGAGSASMMTAAGAVGSGATCTATPTGTVPKAAFTQSASACAPSAAPAACDGGICASGQKLCVLQSGDRACPASFGTKSVFYAGVDDTRACDCSCSAPQTCAVFFYPNNMCIAAQGISSSTCQMRFSNINAVRNTGTCTSNLSTTGTVTPQMPTTVCCEP